MTKKRLDPATITELPDPHIIDATLEELDFSVLAQAAEGHELLRVVGLLGALAMWEQAQRAKEERRRRSPGERI